MPNSLVEKEQDHLQKTWVPDCMGIHFSLLYDYLNKYIEPPAKELVLAGGFYQ